jgi:MFS family permease
VLGWIETHRDWLPESMQDRAGWRLAFFLVAAPGPLVAALVLAIGPVRRNIDDAIRRAGGSLVEYLKENAAAAGGLYAALGLYGLALYAMYAWTPVYIVRILGVSPAETGVWIGVAYSAGSVAGVILAWVIAKIAARRLGIMAPVRIYQFSMLFALVPILMQLGVTEPWQAYTLVAVQTAATNMGAALVPTMLQDISPAMIRGRVIAFATFVYSLVTAAAPVLVGALSDSLSAQPRGLLWALVIVSAPCMLAAFIVLKITEPAFRRTINAYAPV